MAFEVISIATCAAAWKLLKELPELLAGRRKTLREEAEFADKFLKRVSDGDLPAIAVEKGYQALAGSRAVRAKGIQHLLSLSDDPRLLQDYVDGIHYIDMKDDTGELRFQFSDKSKSRQRRTWLKFQCNAMYAVFFLFGLLPFVIALFRQGFEPLLYLLVTVPVFMPLAFLCAADGMKVVSAERVIQAQEAANSKANSNADMTEELLEMCR